MFERTTMASAAAATPRYYAICAAMRVELRRLLMVTRRRVTGAASVIVMRHVAGAMNTRCFTLHRPFFFDTIYADVVLMSCRQRYVAA